MRSKAKKDAESFRFRTGVDWVDSRSVTNCAECHDKFTVLNRKHHCRQCGQVICKKCSPERVLIGEVKVRICQSCYDDTSIRGDPSASISSFDACLTCFFCGALPNDKVGTFVEGRIKGQELIYWHSSCMSCQICQKALKFHETYIFPMFGNPDNQMPQCYCEAHVPNPSNLTIDMSHVDQTLDPALNVDSKLSPSAASGAAAAQVAVSHPSTPINPFQPLQISYGPSLSQYFILHIPREKVSNGDLLPSRRSLPLVVILHGGFWKSAYSVTNSCVDTLPTFFMSSGIAVCVVEYRRVGAECPEDEGGWPETGQDILSALCTLHREVLRLNEEVESDPSTRRMIIDVNRIVLLGHSAGGQLALWVCCDPQVTALPFTPLMCVGIAPVANLIQGHRLRSVLLPSPSSHLARLSDNGDAIENFMKVAYDSDDAEAVTAYHSACPSKLLPLPVPTILVTGTSDTDVPHQLVEDFYWDAKRVSGDIISRCILSVSTPSEDGADDLPPPADEGPPLVDSPLHHQLDPKILESFRLAPPPLKLLKLPGATHYDVMDSTSSAWSSIFDEMVSMSPQLSDIPEFDPQLTAYQEQSEVPGGTGGIEEKTDSVDPLPSPNHISSPGRPPPLTPPSPRRIPSSPVSSIAVSGGLVPVKAVDYIWICHVKSLNSFHSHGGHHDDHNDDLLSDGSSDDLPSIRERTSKSRPESSKVNTTSSRDSTASHEHTAATAERPSELFSFPTPKSDRTTKNRFKFAF
jgi:acetyl esterase/lipase